MVNPVIIETLRDEICGVIQVFNAFNMYGQSEKMRKAFNALMYDIGQENSLIAEPEQSPLLQWHRKRFAENG